MLGRFANRPTKTGRPKEKGPKNNADGAAAHNTNQIQLAKGDKAASGSNPQTRNL
jgi:hypothetical protein